MRWAGVGRLDQGQLQFLKLIPKIKLPAKAKAFGAVNQADDEEDDDDLR